MAVIVVVVGLVVVGAISNAFTRGDGPKETIGTAAPVSLTRSVTYMVTGNGTNKATIIYRTPTGTGQQSDIDLPLKRKSDGGAGIIYPFHRGDFLYISAQNSNDVGAVKCTISVDGTIVSSNSASGAYAIASCQASA